jgi:hypothetical protein
MPYISIPERPQLPELKGMLFGLVLKNLKTFIQQQFIQLLPFFGVFVYFEKNLILSSVSLYFIGVHIPLGETMFIF